MSRTTTGTKYESTKHLDTAAVAAAIRADVKAAVAAGVLPQGAYSVRIARSSMSASIDVRFVLSTCDLFNAAHLAWTAENPHSYIGAAPESARSRYSPEANDVIATIERLVGAYNRDASDLSSDYFDVRFYSSVVPDSDWARDRRETETLRLRAREVSEEMFGSSASDQFGWVSAMGGV